VPSWFESRPRAVPREAGAVAALLLGALVAWIVTYRRMRGMDAGPGTDLNGLGWYVGVWVTMMAAMMLPSVAPMVLLFDKVSSERAKRGLPYVPTWMFTLAYFAVWTTYGLLAYGVYRAVRALDPGFLAWNRGGPYLVAGLLVLAGLYELTPLKSICLRHCRSPIHFVLGGWRDGTRGALRMGVEHGTYCVGCCWGLMVILFALGVMSLVWMAVVAGVILAQKVLPRGEVLTKAVAVAFVAAGEGPVSPPGSSGGSSSPAASSSSIE
jgi:predicted metal-binding membrane protein